MKSTHATRTNSQTPIWTGPGPRFVNPSIGSRNFPRPGQQIFILNNHGSTWSYATSIPHQFQGPVDRERERNAGHARHVATLDRQKTEMAALLHQSLSSQKALSDALQAHIQATAMQQRAGVMYHPSVPMDGGSEMSHWAGWQANNDRDLDAQQQWPRVDRTSYSQPHNSVHDPQERYSFTVSYPEMTAYNDNNTAVTQSQTQSGNITGHETMAGYQEIAGYEQDRPPTQLLPGFEKPRPVQPATDIVQVGPWKDSMHRDEAGNTQGRHDLNQSVAGTLDVQTGAWDQDPQGDLSTHTVNQPGSGVYFPDKLVDSPALTEGQVSSPLMSIHQRRAVEGMISPPCTMDDYGTRDPRPDEDSDPPESGLSVGNVLSGSPHSDETHSVINRLLEESVTTGVKYAHDPLEGIASTKIGSSGWMRHHPDHEQCRMGRERKDSI